MAQLTIEIPAIALSIETIIRNKISITTLVLIVLEIARMIFRQILEQISEMFVEEYFGKEV